MGRSSSARCAVAPLSRFVFAASGRASRTAFDNIICDPPGILPAVTVWALAVPGPPAMRSGEASASSAITLAPERR